MHLCIVDCIFVGNGGKDCMKVFVKIYRFLWMLILGHKHISGSINELDKNTRISTYKSP